MGYTDDVQTLDSQLAAYFASAKHGGILNRADVAAQQAAFQRLYQLAAMADHQRAAHEAEQAELAQVQAEPAQEAPAPEPCAGCGDKTEPATPGRMKRTAKARHGKRTGNQTGQGTSEPAGTPGSGEEAGA
jgi:hypothetical protein